MRIGFLRSSDQCYNSIDHFMRCIEEALKRRGVETLWLLEDEMIGPLDAIIAINDGLVSAKDENDIFYMDRFRCPLFLILLDPPYFHHGILRSHMKDLFLIVLDQEHVEYCKRYYGPLRDVDRAYMLGPAKELISFEEKKIDCLFTGTFDYGFLDMEMIQNGISKIYGSEISKACFERLIQIRIESPEMTTLQAVLIWLEEQGISYPDDQLKQVMNVFGTYSDAYMNAFYRKRLIQTLIDAGLTVHVAGKGWESLYPVCPRNLILEGVVDFGQTAELIADAKIVLNATVVWNDGIHDRVLTTMWNGSVCVTDPSSYMYSHFQDDKDIVFYDFSRLADLPERIKKLLEDPVKASSIAGAGYRKVHDRYTWDLFVKRYILDKIDVAQGIQTFG